MVKQNNLKARQSMWVPKFPLQRRGEEKSFLGNEWKE